MQFFKYCLVAVVLVGLVAPTECFLDFIWKGIEMAIGDVVKAACKPLMGIVCPAAVGLGAAAATAGSFGVAAPVAGSAATAGIAGCKVGETQCKRSVDMSTVMIPFSDEMNDYDFDEDKHISYTEFVWAVVNSVNMENPDDLMKPFAFADVNGDGQLDLQEFNGAPFLFAHFAGVAYQNTTVVE